METNSQMMLATGHHIIKCFSSAFLRVLHITERPCLQVVTLCSVAQWLVSVCCVQHRKTVGFGLKIGLKFIIFRKLGKYCSIIGGGLLEKVPFSFRYFLLIKTGELWKFWEHNLTYV